MERQKRAQIAFGDPDNSTDSVHDEIASFDPPADGTGGYKETFGDLSDGEEVDLILVVTPTTDLAETYGTCLSDADPRP
jgi:hypothetical protein